MAGVLSLVAFIAGCSSFVTAIHVPDDQYPDAIAATRDVLRSYRFQIDRVDAAQGVVTTLPKPSSGIATPWDAEQSSFNQELEDLANSQERRVRVVFQRPAWSSPEPGAGASLPSEPAVGRMMHVEVTIDRVQRPGWRPTPKSVRHSTVTMDPDLAARQMWPTYSVPIRQDPEFAHELMFKIEDRLRDILHERAPDVPTEHAGAP